MSSELTPLLLRMALSTSVAIVLMLLARRPLRRLFGASLAYLAWLVVPVVAVAALLPGRSAPQVLSLQMPQAVQAMAAQASPVAAPAQADMLLAVWAAGVLACATWFVHAHRSFLRRAGRLTRRGGVYVSDADIGPASIGLLRPKIVVPHDFDRRYGPIEQSLIIAHEQTHIARRDAVANLAAAFFQCLFWFNPLVHLGVRRMRQDQELACDAAVMARHPRQRRAYAEALLKSHTGLAVIGAGLHCHWQSPHPTKERIMSLQQALPGTLRRVAGRCAVVLLAAGAFGATLGVRAEPAAASSTYAIALTVDSATRPPEAIKLLANELAFSDEPKSTGEKGKATAVSVIARAGESFSVASDGWRIDMTVRAADTPDRVWLAGKLYKGKTVVSNPTLLASLGEPATVKVGDDDAMFSMTMKVTAQP